MSDLQHHTETEQHEPTEEHLVEVRRNGGLALAVGAVASVVAILYLSRATGTGAWLDWLLCALMAVLAAAYLQAFVDARTPLLVADRQGLRLRRGRSWQGMPWADVEALEHLPRAGVLRDGRLEVFPREGDPRSVPLSLSTTVVGAGEDLTATLHDLADGRAEVLEVYDAAPGDLAEDLADDPADDVPGEVAADVAHADAE